MNDSYRCKFPDISQTLLSQSVGFVVFGDAELSSLQQNLPLLDQELTFVFGRCEGAH